MSEWGAPQNLVWFWAVPSAIALFIVASLRARGQMKRFGDVLMIRKLVSSLSPARRWFKRILILLALASMVAALCQPHFSKKEVTVDRQGVDVVIALDVSRSMLAKDMSPNRLEKAKLELTDLVEKLKGDRIGIVAFAGEAVIVCPLTFDKSAIRLFLSTAHPNLIPRQGTAIAQALRVAKLAFADKDTGDKVIILLTDGEDHEEDPREIARVVKKENITIYAIGFGTSEGSTVPLGTAGDGFKKDRQGRPVISKMNEGVLKAVAQETGGAYYRATRGEVESSRIAAEIRKMSQKGYGTRKSVEYEENFQIFLVLALVLLCLELGLSERKRSHQGKASALILILLLSPFLVGFKFFSPVKNEEGNRFYKKGQVGKAKKSYLAARKMDPDSPVVAYNLGNAYYKEESYGNSLEAYKQAAQEIKDPRMQSGAFYNLGNTLVRTGDTAKAIDFYKQALRLNPQDQDAKFNLELLMKRPPQQQKKDQQKQNQKNQQNQQNNKDNSGKDNQQSQDKSPEDQKNQEGQSGQKDQKDQQDQKDSQNQQNQQKDSQNQQNKPENQKDEQQQSGEKGEGNSEDKKNQEAPQSKPSEGGEKDKDKESQKGQDKQDAKDGQKPQEGNDEKAQEKPSNENAEDGKGDEQSKEPGEEKEREGGAGKGDEKDQQEQPFGEDPQDAAEGQGDEEEKPAPSAPKSDSQKRAEQILNALENQERQVLKLQSGQNKPVRNVPIVNEKDW